MQCISLRFLELDPECPGSCSYTRDGQGEDQVYCFGPGPRTGAFECAAVTGQLFISFEPLFDPNLIDVSMLFWKSLMTGLAHATPSSNP